MPATLTLTEDDLKTALRGFLLSVTDGDVVSGQQNDVAMPLGPFIEMTPIRTQELCRPWSTYHDAGAGLGVETIHRSSSWTCQLDCFGKQAQNAATVISTLFRTDFACRHFANRHDGIVIQPLYASEPRQLPFINAEMNYEKRWVVEVTLQFNALIVVPAAFARELHVTPVPIETLGVKP